MTDRRKGLKRLALAVGVPYFVAWTLVGLAAWRSGQHWMRELQSLPPGNYQLTEIYTNRIVEKEEMVQLAVFFGVVVPVILLIVGPLAYWVYRGFKPKINS